MKLQIKIIGLCLMAVATCANAADDASKWNGLQIGISAGYGWAHSSTDVPVQAPFVATPAHFSLDGDGAIYGGNVGYDYAVNPNLVVGLALDFAKTDISGSSCFDLVGCSGASGDSYGSGEIDWLATFRGKAGIPYQNALFYVTGGYALARLDSQDTHLFGTLDTPSHSNQTHDGWTAGAGVDYLIKQNISVGIKYLYVDLGEEKYKYLSPVILPGSGISANTSLDLHVLQFSLNYKF